MVVDVRSRPERRGEDDNDDDNDEDDTAVSGTTVLVMVLLLLVWGDCQRVSFIFCVLVDTRNFNRFCDCFCGSCVPTNDPRSMYAFKERFRWW